MASMPITTPADQNIVPNEPPPTYDAAANPRAPPPIPGGINRTPSRLSPFPPLDLPVLNQLRDKRVILASASPRRRQLLAQIGLMDIEIIPSKFSEDLDKKQYTPFEYVQETATRKCMAVYEVEINNVEKGEPALVLSADTIIVSNGGVVIEKPRNERHHVEMLKALRDGEPHKVYTAVAAMVPKDDSSYPGYSLETYVGETIVKFDKMVTDDLIESYVKTREGADKAGGYAIQGIGAILVEKIEGTYDNVVGLPLRGTLRCIEKAITNEDFESDGEESG